MTLEICAYNIQSCLIAHKAGANRIELCADPFRGGTTPSYGVIKYALENIGLPVYPIISTKGNSFVYDKAEIEILRNDIFTCRQLGCEGISIGASLPDGRIDVALMKQIVEWARPMKLSCHKVFDAAPDLHEALEGLIEVGFDRVLTSGGCKTALEGIDIIAALTVQAQGRIVIMPGGSLRSANLEQIRSVTQANEFHSSGITSNDGLFLADEQEVSRMVEMLKLG